MRLLKFEAIDTHCTQCAKPMRAATTQSKPMCRKCFKHYGQRVWTGSTRIHRR